MSIDQEDPGESTGPIRIEDVLGDSLASIPPKKLAIGIAKKPSARCCAKTTPHPSIPPNAINERRRAYSRTSARFVWDAHLIHAVLYDRAVRPGFFDADPERQLPPAWRRRSGALVIGSVGQIDLIQIYAMPPPLPIPPRNDWRTNAATADEFVCPRGLPIGSAIRPEGPLRYSW
jgi:hypothetical protein